ncbi:hypothetical protein [Nioella nitratireducens]|uniref:hypothetical protein n=1 Tax=Nioella nitratireducens TaxID=1287720 RepID=UPI0008FD4F90|nr:hypothetical protein [Nioella nitratireducens]
MTDERSQIAVLTGDLVQSTAAGASLTNKAIGRISSMAAITTGWPGNNAGHFTRFRGDGWQFVVDRPAWALRALICVHAVLRQDEDGPISRIAIGLGPLDPVTGDDLSDASGPALVASGRALDNMDKAQVFAIVGKGVTPLHHAVLALVEDRVTRWTVEQAEAAAYFLSPTAPTLKSIAETLHISTQAVHARLKGAGAQSLRRAVEAWEQAGAAP